MRKIQELEPDIYNRSNHPNVIRSGKEKDVLERYADLHVYAVGNALLNAVSEDKKTLSTAAIRQSNLAPHHQEVALAIAAQYAEMMQQVDSLEKSLHNGLSASGEWIETRQALSDAYVAELEKEVGSDEYKYFLAAGRIATTPTEAILPVMDFDNTMTDGDAHIKHLPTKSMELLLKQYTREAFPLLTLITTHRVLMRDTYWFREVGKNQVRFRPGVREFLSQSAKYTKDEQLPIILSANYEEVIIGALEQLPQAHEQVAYLAVTTHSILSTVKDKALQYLARKHNQKAVVFIGDGSSDLPALQAGNNVAFYFALEGCSFEAACKEHGVLYFPYRDFQDIQETLDKIYAHLPTFDQPFAEIRQASLQYVIREGSNT